MFTLYFMNIKEKYRTRKLKKELAKIKRTPFVRNIEELKKIGVIWQPQQKEAVNYLRNYFNKNHIVFRTYCVFDELSNPSAANNTLTTNDLNWWGIPKPEKTQDFMQAHFDVLLNIAMKQDFVLDYITALTHADFKIGWSPNEQNYFDLNINIGENQDVMFLVEQQIFYLAQLNKKNSR